MKMQVWICALLFLIANLLQAQTNFWQQTNGPFGESVASIRITSNNTIFIGGTYPYRSTDLGNSWNRLELNTTVRDFCIYPNGTILAASSGSGLWRTTNEGVVWTHVGPNSTGFLSLLRTLSGSLFAGSLYSGLYRSTDIGATWSFAALSGKRIDVLIKDSAGQMYAGTYGYGIYLSTDNGISWSQRGLSNLEVYAVAINQSGELFAGTQSGVWRSSNNGLNWLQLSATQYYVSAIAINSNGDIFAGYPTGGILVSTDDGTSWTGVNGPALIQAIAVDDFDNLYAGTLQSGVFRSTNNGYSWNSINSVLSRVPVLTLAVNRSGIVTAGSTSYGVYSSSNLGESWEQLGLTNFTQITSISCKEDSLLFAGVYYYGSEGFYYFTLFRSTNNGRTWTPYNLGQNGGAAGFAITASGYILDMTAGNGVYRSTDNGSTWSQTNSGTGSGRAIAANGIDGDVYVSIANRGLLRSTDDGNNWSQMNIDYSFAPLATSGANELFAGHGPSGLFRSTNDGATWLSTSLINMTIKSIVVNSLHYVFVGSDQGVFRSRDNGVMWEQINSGLADSNVTSVALDSAGYLYAATSASGVYRSRISTLTSVSLHGGSLPTEFGLSQNYPNPFNPTTKIEFRLPAGKAGIANFGFVSLKVFDLLGREVATLVNEEMRPGRYERVFDGSGLASGIYIYRLQAQDFIQSKKLLLLK